MISQIGAVGGTLYGGLAAGLMYIVQCHNRLILHHQLPLILAKKKLQLMSDILLLRYQSSNEKAEVEKGDAKDKVSKKRMQLDKYVLVKWQVT